MDTPRSARSFIVVVLIAVAAVGGYLTRRAWLPTAERWFDSASVSRRAATDEHSAGDHHDEHEHEGHSHKHAPADAVELSDQARKNIGLRTQMISLQPFEKALSVPGLVEERPGRTRIQVATPMTAVVTEVHVIKGEAATPGKLLFKLRLTHEDLVEAQTNFLQTLGELDVETRKIERLRKIGEGVLPGNSIRDREDAREKLEAHKNALREALLLHGLTSEQVDGIAKQRKLLREIHIYAPASGSKSQEIRLSTQVIQQVVALLPDQKTSPAEGEANRPFVVQELKAHQGQAMQAGETLCTLADFSSLQIRGDAFDADTNDLQRAAAERWPVAAILQREQKQSETVPNLRIEYLANEIDVDTRALHFFVNLPNSIVQDSTNAEGHRFIGWRFRPGQRMQLRIPVERWTDRIVLPIDAVSQDGGEEYVFQESGRQFKRRRVHVEYRDALYAVIANDGSIFPGDTIAASGAHQLLLALKNQSGGAIDPHAGHHH